MSDRDDELEELEAREKLRRLVDAMAGPPPDEEESRRLCAEVGIDVDALYARVMARVRAYDGAAAADAPPQSGRRAVDPHRDALASEEEAPSVQGPTEAIASKESPRPVIGPGSELAAVVSAAMIALRATAPAKQGARSPKKRRPKRKP